MEYLDSLKLSIKECELLAMKVDRAHRQDEATLVRSRWFDYVRLHPVQATYLYAALYKKQTRIFYESYIDERTAENARAFTPDDIFASRDMTGMWLARRFADSHGLPYKFVLQFAQERCFSQLWSRFPRPNQLYGEELEIDLLASWKETLATSLRYSRASQFKASNHCGRASQVRHAAFLIGQIKARQRPHVNLLGRMFAEGVLGPHLASGHFTPEEISQAQSVASSLAVSHH